jgi:thiosulfate/3-mercaptopyruvate sulfurtransferase
MPYTTIVDTSTLTAHLHDPDWAIVDCRLDLGQPAWGAAEYERAHVPGAVFADMARDLAGPKTGTNGRHPLPDPTVLAGTLGRLGIGPGVQVVVYDQDLGMYAARLWWMLHWLGHTNVAVLDGGWARWIADARPTAGGIESRPIRVFTGSPRSGMTATTADVALLMHDAGARLVDARAPERYRGEVEPIDRIGGHIPGAVNHCYKTNAGPDGRMRSPEELAALWRQTLGGTKPERVVCYCGSGITACHDLLALEHAGLRGAKLYPGSWSEWSSDPARPVAKGEKP